MRIVLVVLTVSLLATACSQPAVNTHANNTLRSNAGNANANSNVNSNTNSNSNTSTATKLESVAVDPAADSVYTGISDKVCKEQEPEDDSGAIFQMECTGTAGYKYVYSESDHSSALSVIDPQGKETLLPFGRVVASAAGFRMGDKVEWRMDGKGSDAKPNALIVRIRKFVDPVNFDKSETYLAVASLRGEPCITDMVPGATDQNKKAREFADTKGRKCIEVKSE